MDIRLRNKCQPDRVVKGSSGAIPAGIQYATRSPAEFAIDIGLQNQPEAASAAREYLGRLESELLGPAPTALERLLVERITVCWWRIQESEMAYTAARTISGTDRLVLFHKRIERAQRIYVQAILALARVRQMALPDIRISHQSQIIINQPQANDMEDNCEEPNDQPGRAG